MNVVVDNSIAWHGMAMTSNETLTFPSTPRKFKKPSSTPKSKKPTKYSYERSIVHDILVSG
jgi:hypothetical protein